MSASTARGFAYYGVDGSEVRESSGSEKESTARKFLRQRMQDEPSLRAEYERLLALRTVIAAHVHKDKASDSLRAKISAIAEPVAPTARVGPPRLYDVRQMAAAVFAAAILAGSATMFVARYDGAGDTTALIAAHQRALVAASPVEVVSEDRHTVKPWFDHRLALSPRVVDLAPDGFTLVGGRADHIAGKSLPVMVYRIRAHLISLVAIPRPGSIDDGRAVTRATRDGYAVLTWPGRDFVYSAISDVADSDLSTFVARWRAEAKAN